MIRIAIPILAALLWSTSAAHAALQCVPLDGSARILASADGDDIHPDWEDSSVGLSWTFIAASEEKEGGTVYYSGELVDPRGNTVNEDVYIIAAEWDCS
jgi:hypothetical protein